MNSKAQQILQGLEHPELEITIDADMRLFSTMRLKAQGQLAVVKSLAALKYLLENLHVNGMKYRVIGWGANALLPENASDIYLQLDFPFDKSYLDAVKDVYHLPASVSLSILSSHAVKFGVKGWEVFTGVPASLGGALYMNAGTNLGEIAALVRKVYIINTKGELLERVITAGDYSYRKNHFLKPGEIIYAADLGHFGVDPQVSAKIKDYLALRNRTQPLKEFTCGCIFKNAESHKRSCRAGHHIDIIGLKGIRLGDIEVSPKHANFMVNRANGTRTQVESLIELLQDELKMSFGIDFETEVEKF